MKIVPELNELYESDRSTKEIIDMAKKIEGNVRHISVHAAGVIITEKPVVTYCPLYVGKDGDVVTQFDKDFSEKIGLVKFDFLVISPIKKVTF